VTDEVMRLLDRLELAYDRAIRRPSQQAKHLAAAKDAIAELRLLLGSADDKAVERHALLTQFGLMTEERLAVLLGVAVKTLQNREQGDLPPFTKTGNERLYYKDDVAEYLRKRVNRQQR
jgi:DNA-binding transcriptional regulator YiaG